MKLLLLSLFTFLTSFTFAQINLFHVEFYTWTSQDNVQYSTIILMEDFTEMNDSKAVARVKYTMEGLTKMVEFSAESTYNIEDDIIDVMIMADETASFVKGSGSYTPDNFILTFDLAGDLLSAFQADHTELTKGENAHLAEMSPIIVNDANHLRDLIKEFYTSSDSLYRDLMTYAAQYD